MSNGEAAHVPGRATPRRRRPRAPARTAARPTLAPRRRSSNAAGRCAHRQSPAAPSRRHPASSARRSRCVPQWFNSINEDRASSDQSHRRRSDRQRAADRRRRGSARARRAPISPSRRSSRSPDIFRAIFCSTPASSVAAGRRAQSLASDARERTRGSRRSARAESVG